MNGAGIVVLVASVVWVSFVGPKTIRCSSFA
jgi:hypothetical protein